MSKLVKTKKEGNAIPLWNKDFTILTLGSIISYMGSAVVVFVLRLLVLDVAESVFLFSIYLFLHSAVKVLAPLVAGPFLDRFSRKRMVYTLDFCSTGLYIVLWLLFRGGLFRYWMVFFIAVIVGAIESIYRVAFTSLFPMAVHPDNLSKAYSVLGGMEIFSRIMVPVAAFLYKAVDIAPVLLICAVAFGTAAVTETFIRTREDYTESNTQTLSLKSYAQDFREGFTYLKAEQALLVLVLCELLVSFIFGVEETILLPYFNFNVANGYFWYMVVTGADMTGQFWGSMLLYAVKIPRKHSYFFLVLALLAVAALSGSLLFLPVLAMVGAALLLGIFEFISINIRTSSAQLYVPDHRKARYNGIYSMTTSFGLILGELAAGGMSERIPLPYIHLLVSALVAVIVLVVLVAAKGKTMKAFFASLDKNNR